MNYRYQVFISSTYKDLKRQRRLVAEAVQLKSWYPAGMELFPASDVGAWDHIQKAIDQSDLYLLLIGGRYGSHKPGELSSNTELEYDLARKNAAARGLRFAVLVWDQGRGATYLSDVDDPTSDSAKSLSKFRAKVSTDMADGLGYFYDDASLISHVHGALDRFREEAGPGWIRADQSPEHQELVDLDEKVKTLERRIQESEARLASTRKVAALPSEVVEVGCDVVYKNRYKQSSSLPNQTAAITWREVFSKIGAELDKDIRSESDLMKTLSALARGKFKHESEGFTLASVSMRKDDCQRILDHLRRNEWTRPLARERTGRHYELTDLGREAFLENQTVVSMSHV